MVYVIDAELGQGELVEQEGVEAAGDVGTGQATDTRFVLAVH